MKLSCALREAQGISSCTDEALGECKAEWEASTQAFEAGPNLKFTNDSSAVI
jgi:hypothetical protein